MLSYLHKKFNYEQKKNLLKAVFEKIYIKNKVIIDVKFNPPFSLLLGDDLKKMFEDSPTAPIDKSSIPPLINSTSLM